MYLSYISHSLSRGSAAPHARMCDVSQLHQPLDRALREQFASDVRMCDVAQLHQPPRRTPERSASGMRARDVAQLYQSPGHPPERNASGVRNARDAGVVPWRRIEQKALAPEATTRRPCRG